MSCIGVIGEVSGSELFVWKIPDFLSLSTEKNSFYMSPSFAYNNISFHLSIYPGGWKLAKNRFISVFLEKESPCQSRLHVTLMLHIKKADGTLIGGGSRSAFLNTLLGYSHFYDRSHLEEHESELVPSGILTIACTLKLTPDENQAKKIKLSTHEDKTMNFQRLSELDVLSENLKDFFTNKDSCDVVLEVEGEEFKAHKAILMARSPVFAAMFQHDTLEKQTGIVKIPDCDSKTFHEFLGYLYSGKLEDVSRHSAFHLYCTSNKYDVQKLKEFCLEYLVKSLSPDNVCDFAKLADKYNETKLITEAQVVFNEN